MKNKESRIEINSDYQCGHEPSLEVIYDIGTEGERKYLVCSSCILKKPFSMHIKSQKPIGDKNG